MSPASVVREKQAVAQAAALLVEDGMRVGLGTGSTVGFFLPALAARRLDIRCVATSLETELTAREVGLAVEPFDQLERLDLAVDGADQVAPDGWLVKGGGGAHTREKIVVAAAERFVVIVSSDKVVEAIRPPVPLELIAFGLRATLRLVGETRLRGTPPTVDGGVLADYVGQVGSPVALAQRLSAIPGLVEHGLFAPELVAEVLVARGDWVERRLVSDRE